MKKNCLNCQCLDYFEASYDEPVESGHFCTGRNYETEGDESRHLSQLKDPKYLATQKRCCQMREVKTPLKVQKYERTKKGLVSRLYNAQKQSSKRRGHNPPAYTRQEFAQWLFSQKKFATLFERWIESGYDKDFKPSADRLDNSKGYSFDNIQLTTWRENRHNGFADNSYQAKESKPVKAINIKTGVESLFESMKEAFRITGVDTSAISKCTRGIAKTAGGFQWSLQ